MKKSVILDVMLAAFLVATLTSCSLLSSGNNQPVGDGQPATTFAAPVEQNTPASGGGRETGGVTNADGDSSGTGGSSGSSSTPTEQAVSTAASCANGVAIPVGVDASIVCASSLPSTVRLPGFKSPYSGDNDVYYGFKSPTGNLACAWYHDDGPTVVCSALVLDVAYPHDPRNDSCPKDIAECSADGLYVADDSAGVDMHEDVRPINLIQSVSGAPVLGYGQTAISTDYPMMQESNTPNSPVACYSAQDGITCWNTVTHHGIKISRTQAIYW